MIRDTRLAIALKLETLLREAADEDLADEIREATEMLDSRGLLPGRVQTSDPRSFVRTVILENDRLELTEEDAAQAADALTVEELIAGLPEPVLD
jgi:hypothetical protein